MFDSFAQYQSGLTQTDYASMTRTTVQTCVRALSRFFRVAQFAVTAVRPLRRKAVLITCLAIVEKDLHDTICAKPACDRVHPVAVVTASSRMSRMWLACCCSPRPIIGMNEHWTNPHMARPLVGARVAIWRASFATSDCWQSPQLPGGLGQAPVSRQLHRGGLFQRLPSK